MASTKPVFQRLVRFEDNHGGIHYGEISAKHKWTDSLVDLTVPVYDGTLPWEADFRLSERTAKIVKVLSPIASTPIVYGIGLNYKKHAEEASVALPPFPTVFIKGVGTGPYEDITIHGEAEYLDYEGELALIFSKSALNLTETDNVYDYILGYTCSNDVSSRYWQDPVRSGGQHGYAKAFDKFSPIGPVLASTLYVPDPSKLTLRTVVNGEQRQLTETDDLIFDVPAIVRHLTRGRTVRPGTVVMTGTPSGVAAFHKPPKWLKDGDVVEVEISELGQTRNKMVFRK